MDHTAIRKFLTLALEHTMEEHKQHCTSYYECPMLWGQDNLFHHDTVSASEWIERHGPLITLKLIRIEEKRMRKFHKKIKQDHKKEEKKMKRRDKEWDKAKRAISPDTYRPFLLTNTDR